MSGASRWLEATPRYTDPPTRHTPTAHPMLRFMLPLLCPRMRRSLGAMLSGQWSLTAGTCSWIAGREARRVCAASRSAVVAVGLAALFDHVLNRFAGSRDRRLLLPLTGRLVPFEDERLALEPGREPVERLERFLLGFLVGGERRLGVDGREARIVALRRCAQGLHLVRDHLPFLVDQRLQIVLHEVLVIVVRLLRQRRQIVAQPRSAKVVIEQVPLHVPGPPHGLAIGEAQMLQIGPDRRVVAGRR